MATSRHVHPECTIEKARLWKMVNDNQTEAQISFEQSSDSSGESTTLEYKTPLMDHKEGKRIFVKPRSILRAEVA